MISMFRGRCNGDLPEYRSVIEYRPFWYPLKEVIRGDIDEVS